jgi:lactose/L-arabinose transport system substrate-binding protein
MIKDNSPETAGDWGVFPMPAAYPGGVRVCNLGGSVLVIPEQTSHPEAAWAFIEYALCTRAGQIAQFKSRDLFPALLPALDDPFVDEPDPFFGNQPVRRLFATDLDKIPTLTRTRDWVEARRYISQGLSRWATQNQDHEAFLARMTDKLRRKLGREVAVAGETPTLR